MYHPPEGPQASARLTKKRGRIGKAGPAELQRFFTKHSYGPRLYALAAASLERAVYLYPTRTPAEMLTKLPVFSYDLNNDNVVGYVEAMNRFSDNRWTMLEEFFAPAAVTAKPEPVMATSQKWVSSFAKHILQACTAEKSANLHKKGTWLASLQADPGSGHVAPLIPCITDSLYSCNIAFRGTLDKTRTAYCTRTHVKLHGPLQARNANKFIIIMILWMIVAWLITDGHDWASFTVLIQCQNRHTDVKVKKALRTLLRFAYQPPFEFRKIRPDPLQSKSAVSKVPVTIVRPRKLNVGASIGFLMKLMDSSGDSANMPGGVCSNCIESGSECTHLTGKRAQNRAGRPTLPDLEEYASTSSKAYHISTWAAPQGDRGDVQKTLTEFSEYIKVLEARLSSQDTSESEPGTPESEDDADAVLADHLRYLTMRTSRERFYGKSSGLVLRKTASTVIANAGLSSRPSARRPEMWQVYSWQIMQESRPDFLIFPDDDLMETLIDLYFTHWNLFRPLLHRPSFEKSLRQGLHYRDYYFGATVLVVCALGSTYSNDRRVFLDDTTELSGGGLSSVRYNLCKGRHWLHLHLYTSFSTTLSVIFMHGTSLKASWAVLGIALRLAQDHRKLAVDPKSTSAIDNESWKRVFWCLTVQNMDSLNNDSFDQEYPFECDDEHWLHSDPEKAFKQPAGRPSTISYFISYLKLVGILEMAQRILYAANSTIPRKQAVSQLDEALAKWMDSVPAHLRWDPHRKDMLFFRQSGCLYTTYYYVKMLVHQPELLYSSSNSVGSVEAARRCTDVLEHLSRKAPLAVPLIHVILFSSTAMLLINHWKNPSQSKKDLDDVGRYQKFIQSQENRWQIAGKLSDTITGLLTQVDQSFPYVQVSSRKRPQEESWASTSQLSNQPSTSQVSNQHSARLLSKQRFTSIFGICYRDSGHPAANQSQVPPQVQPPTNIITSKNVSYPTLPRLNLPTDTTEAEIENLLLTTSFPDLEATEHSG
ncbi:hypothetical protein C8J56DRAFT_1111495 [Mycena floridula]|nr:hypothetical protein C8J56DRAFT_1111495 [Mycena floridula]